MPRNVTKIIADIFRAFTFSALLLAGSGLYMNVHGDEGGPLANRSVFAGEKVLIHHWNFNDIPNNVNFDISEPELMHVSSRLYGASLTYEGTRWDRVNHPTTINARELPYEENDDRALRLRNPAGDFTISLPTDGYRDPVFRYAVTRTPNGAHYQRITYSTDGGETFWTEGLDENLFSVDEGSYKLVELDLSDVPDADDNPDFMIRIEMAGEGSEPDNNDGNHRINNITLDGYVMEDAYDRQLIHYWQFDNIPNDVDFPLEVEISSGGITGGQSSLDGAWIRYDGARWDRVNAPTPFNARAIPYEEDDDRALRLRNPTGDFLLGLPTTDHENVVVSYAVKRTSNGAAKQEIAYSLDGEQFETEGLKHSSVEVGENYILHVLDFTDMGEVNDNPDFTLRIRAAGEGAEPENDDGNQRFNHISVDATPTFTSADEYSSERPSRIRLEQNYPNPFNPATTIRFTLPEQKQVTLEVFDVTGRHVETLVDESLSAGEHSRTFNAENLSSGIYLYRLQAGGESFTRRMMFVK